MDVVKVGRPTGSKDFLDVEKNAILETIKEYSLFNMQDKEIREIASEWLDIFCKSQVIDYYWQRIKEVELTQKYLIQRYLKEVEKIKTGEDDPNVLSKLATSIRENAKMLTELGMAPPILSRLQEIIPKNVKDIQNNKIILKNNVMENNESVARDRVESEIYLSVDPESTIIDPT